jgi:hypothetical protein
MKIHQDRIDTVLERLSFINKLKDLKPHFLGKEFLKHNERTGCYLHPIKHFNALRYYLCLTCFDVLGQTNDFIDYSSWLNSKNHENERNNIFVKCHNTNTQEFLISVYNEYNKKYGVSKAFYRFTNEILTKDNRQKILESIRVTKHIESPPKQVDYIPSKKKKLDYLLHVRNSFTHIGKLLAAIGYEAYSEFDMGITDKDYFHSIHVEKKKRFS